MVAFLNYLHLHMKINIKSILVIVTLWDLVLFIVYVPFCYQLHCFKINNKLISDDENIYFGKTWVV